MSVFKLRPASRSELYISRHWRIFDILYGFPVQFEPFAPKGTSLECFVRDGLCLYRDGDGICIACDSNHTMHTMQIGIYEMKFSDMNLFERS